MVITDHEEWGKAGHHHKRYNLRIINPYIGTQLKVR